MSFFRKLVSPVSPAASAAPPADISAAMHRLGALEAQNAALEAHVTNLTADLERLNEQATAAIQRADAADATAAEARTVLAAMTGERDANARDLAALRTEFDTFRAAAPAREAHAARDAMAAVGQPPADLPPADAGTAQKPQPQVTADSTPAQRMQAYWATRGGVPGMPVPGKN